MGRGRADVTRQLEQAQQGLETCVANLQGQGVEASHLRRHPAWRSADARVRQLSSRLRRVGEVEQLDVSLQERKASPDPENAGDETGE